MITGTISLDDYLAAQRLHRRRLSRWSFVAGGLIAIAGLANLVLNQTPWGVALLSAGLAVALGELLVSKLTLPRRARRLLQQHKDLASPFTYAWDAHFLEARSQRGHSRRPWKDYVGYKEDKDVILLYQADHLFEMFPKRWFPDEASLAEFRRLGERRGA